MKVNEIRVVFQDGIDIPDGYEPVADMRSVKPDEVYIDNSQKNCVARWRLEDNSRCRYPVLRRQWQAPERLRGSGLWLWEFCGDLFLSLDAPQPSEHTGLLEADQSYMVTEIHAALGLTKDALPDWSNTPPAERKVQL